MIFFLKKRITPFMTDSKAVFFHNKNAVFSNSVVMEVPLVPKSTTRIYHLHFDLLQQVLIADVFFFFFFFFFFLFCFLHCGNDCDSK